MRTLLTLVPKTLRYVYDARLESPTKRRQMQTELLEGLAANFATNEYRLLVIDSVMSLYRTDYCGRGELSERQQVLGQFLRRATQMAEEFNLCVLMVRLLLLQMRLYLTR